MQMKQYHCRHSLIVLLGKLSQKITIEDFASIGFVVLTMCKKSNYMLKKRQYHKNVLFLHDIYMYK